MIMWDMDLGIDLFFVVVTEVYIRNCGICVGMSLLCFSCLFTFIVWNCSCDPTNSL